MVFSDCAYIATTNDGYAPKVASALMRRLIESHVPARMGIGRGTFYPEAYATNTFGESLFSRSVFFGTGVIDAHEAEHCGGKGMRVFVSKTVAGHWQSSLGSKRLLELPRPFGAVTHELNYLTDGHGSETADQLEERERHLFKMVSAMYDRRVPAKVRPQYTQSFSALNRMRVALGRKPIITRTLPQYDHIPEGKPWR
jgi:hypothetical protein